MGRMGVEDPSGFPAAPLDMAGLPEPDAGHLRHVVAAAQLGSWEWRPAPDRLTCSPRLLLLLGLPGDRAPGSMRELRRLAHPEDQDELARGLDEHLLGRSPAHIAEYRARHDDGRWVWLEERALVVERELNGAPRVVAAACWDITRRMSVQRSVEWLALHDTLTGLPNRVLFNRELQRALGTAEAGGAEPGLLVLDLDDFKQVNDRFGHAAGDQLLRAVAHRIRSSVRRADVVARIGGDEFAVIMHRAQDQHALGAVASRVVTQLRAPFEVLGRRVTVGASAGTALRTAEHAAPDELVGRADRAMYAAKVRGGGTWRTAGVEAAGQALAAPVSKAGPDGRAQPAVGGEDPLLMRGVDGGCPPVGYPIRT
jgi:diguanylate cyclase (GGDEF)-like protein/PAS domain S-box-containing protein